MDQLPHWPAPSAFESSRISAAFYRITSALGRTRCSGSRQRIAKIPCDKPPVSIQLAWPGSSGPRINSYVPSGRLLDLHRGSDSTDVREVGGVEPAVVEHERAVAGDWSPTPKPECLTGGEVDEEPVVDVVECGEERAGIARPMHRSIGGRICVRPSGTKRVGDGHRRENLVPEEGRSGVSTVGR